MSIITLKNITKKYGDKTILDNFSLNIHEGEFVSLMGQSGCGKSTLLNIIGLLENFDDGEIVIDGVSNPAPNSSKANKLLREKISYLFQNFALVDDETVQYNLNLALKYVKGNKREKKSGVGAVLNYVGLEGYEKRKVYELSGGEQQRVSIARILLKPSKIILADEPTGSLDEKNRDVVIDMLKHLNSKGKTIVLVTHDRHMGSQAHRLINLSR